MLVYHDEQGNILFTLQLGSDIAPPPGIHVEAPDGMLIDPLRWRVSGGQLVPVGWVPEAVRRSAIDEVNARRGQARLHFITDLPGQDALYTAKYEEATAILACEASGSPWDLADFPLIAAEIGVTAPTAYEVAMVMASLNDLWRKAAGAIDAASFAAKDAIQIATDQAGIDAALAGFDAALASIIGSGP